MVKKLVSEVILKKIECQMCESKYKVSYLEEQINEDGSLTCIFCGSTLKTNKEKLDYGDDDDDDQNGMFDLDEIAADLDD